MATKKSGRRKPPTETKSSPKIKVKRKVIPRAKGKRPGVATDVGWHDKFVEVFTQEPCISTACQAAGISRSTFYDHRKRFSDFSALVDEATERAVDTLERVANLRATVGVPRKKFTAKGQPIMDPETGRQYVEYEHSDALIMFLLKFQRPEKYGVDRSKVELSGTVRAMTPEEVVAAHASAMEGITSRIRKAALSGLPNLTGVPA